MVIVMFSDVHSLFSKFSFPSGWTGYQRGVSALEWNLEYDLKSTSP